MQKDFLRFGLIGAAAGLTNGFFGGGGGSILVPLLRKGCGLEQHRAFATSVAIIFPLCILSAALYLFRGGLDLTTAFPYLLGGGIGGWLSGKLFHNVNMRWLRRAFALLLLYGGFRCFL